MNPVKHLLGLCMLIALQSSAHRIEYYTTNGCVITGQPLVIDAYVVSAPATTYYNWQYKDNNNIWTCLVNGNNTINGTVFSVSNVSGTGADNAPALTFSSPGAALDNVQLRCLMRENGSPCGAPAGTVYGGDDLALNEVKVLRLRVNGTASACAMSCDNNLLNSPTGYYGGFERVNYNPATAAFTDSNFVNNGGSSDYLPTGTTGGNYQSVNNPYAAGFSFATAAQFAPHSGNYQMVVNGNATATARVWYKTITVQPGQTYSFSMWVGKVDNNTQPTIQLKANQTELTSGTITGTIGKWTNFTGTYAVPPGVTQVTFAILNKNGIACDFTLDDICLIKTGDPISIGDRVWLDVNRNGSQDAGEPGVGGATVQLFYDGNGDNIADSAATYTTTTNSSGMYLFTGVIPGNYFVQFTLPAGYTGFTTQDAAGVPVGQNSTANVTTGKTGTHNFMADYLFKDAGLLKNIQLSGNVYKDDNALTDNTVNGTLISTLGSSPLYVNLFKGSAFVASVAVSGGTYTFSNLPGATTYTVAISTVQATSASTPASVLPSGWMNTGENIGTAAGNDGTVNGMIAVAMDSVSISNVNFGVKQPVVSGTVYNDLTGLTDNAINGTGTNGGGLYVMLINPSTNKVVAFAAVAANGSFSIPSLGVAAGNYNVALTTTLPVVGNTPPAVSLPSTFVPTGEGTAAAGDGTVNGITPITLGSTGDLSGVKFGINKPPVANTATAASQSNPGGTTSVAVAATLFSGTDPDGGSITSLRLTAFPVNAASIIVNGVQYTSTTFPIDGISIPTNTSGQPTQAIAVDPMDGAVTVTIPFKVTDNAGLQSPLSADVKLPFANTPVPDFTPTIDIDDLAFPAPAAAGSTKDFVVNISEVKNAPSNGQITVKIIKAPFLTYTFNATATSANVFGGTPVNNNDWTVTQTSSTITCVLKTGVVIPGYGLSALGFTATRKAGVAPNTNQTITATIVDGSGGDSNGTNNQYTVLVIAR